MKGLRPSVFLLIDKITENVAFIQLDDDEKQASRNALYFLEAKGFNFDEYTLVRLVIPVNTKEDCEEVPFFKEALLKLRSIRNRKDD